MEELNAILIFILGKVDERVKDVKFDVVDAEKDLENANILKQKSRRRKLMIIVAFITLCIILGVIVVFYFED